MKFEHAPGTLDSLFADMQAFGAAYPLAAYVIGVAMLAALATWANR